MKYFSLFSGVGGFELGIHNAYDVLNRHQTSKKKQKTSENIRGADVLTDSELLQRTPTCIGFSEIDKYATQIYQKHFPDHKNFHDITKIQADTLPDFDLLVGGFPCQAFSIAGKRRGFDDTRGTLFFDIARILKSKKPRNFVLENVKGLLSHDNGRTFATIITTLTELGYCVEWQVINSKNHGVPQNRERVIIVGHLGGVPEREVFPLRENPTADIVLPTLTTRYYGGQANGGYIGNKSELKQIKGGSQGERVYDPSGISTTIASQAGGLGAKTGLYAIPVLTPDRIEKRQNGRRFKTNGEPSFTLNTQDKHGIYDGMKIRRLTPTECERLQGFPDGWTVKGINEKGEEVVISDSQRYKTLGNAVTTNVVEAIVRELFDLK